MKRFNMFFCVVSLTFVLSSPALEVTTIDGERLKDAKCVKVNARGLVIEHREGVTTMMPERLSESSRRDMAEHIKAYHDYIVSRDRDQARTKKFLAERQREFDKDVAALIEQNLQDPSISITFIRERYAGLNLNQSKLDDYERACMQRECDSRVENLGRIARGRYFYVLKESEVIYAKYAKYNLNYSKLSSLLAEEKKKYKQHLAVLREQDNERRRKFDNSERYISGADRRAINRFNNEFNSMFGTDSGSVSYTDGNSTSVSYFGGNTNSGDANREIICPTCRGAGEAAAAGFQRGGAAIAGVRKTCPTCRGAGKIRGDFSTASCPGCNGRGSRDGVLSAMDPGSRNVRCNICNGTGQVLVDASGNMVRN